MRNQPRLLDILRDTVVGSVGQDGPDLTARQLAVLLVCCLDDPPHTVRGLAERLNVAKPAITRAADRLEQLGLFKREDDPRDRRSVLLAATDSGHAFVLNLRAMMVAAADRHAAAPTSVPAAAD
jgi:DNA-binding MarR family transcriptional regulator